MGPVGSVVAEEDGAEQLAVSKAHPGPLVGMGDFSVRVKEPTGTLGTVA